MSKILIIDDDPRICQTLGRFLRQQGHEVITAADGRKGLAATTEKPDLIICDLDMPNLGGHGVLSTLRQNERLQEVPFIFFSGCASHEDIRKAMNMGGDDFLTKPAEVGEILAAVNSRLLRHQQRQQRHEKEVQKAVELFSGIVNDLGSPAAAIHWLAEAAASDQPKQPTPPVAATLKPAPSQSFLAIKDNRRQFVKLSEVKVLLADGEYSKAFWGKDQSMMFRKPLKEWQTELPEPPFIRIHRKAIINLAFLDFVDKNETGKPQVHLKDYPVTLAVSLRKIPTLNRNLKVFQPA
jgi:CheY-like chemotaxis protein